MTRDLDYEVLIVGGGPAGSACAITLATAGVNVALIERDRFPREKICGDTLNPRAWPLLQRLGISDELRAESPTSITKFRVFNSGGRESSLSLSPRSGHPFFAIRRSVLDTILLRRAADLGAIVFESTLVEELALSGEIEVRTRSGGTTAQVRCAFLVGADGRNSVVATKAVPDGSRGRTRGHDGRIGLQWYAPSQPGLKTELHLYLLPFAYFGIVHVDNDTANLAMVLDTRRPGPTSKDLPALIGSMRAANSAISQNLGDLAPVSEVQTTSPITPSSRRRGTGNVHLIGDAGRVVEPFTGEGILFALIDGIRTGERLAATLRGAGAKPQKRPTRFWVNQVASPLLRHPRLADAAVTLGASYPPLTRLASRAILPGMSSRTTC